MEVDGNTIMPSNTIELLGVGYDRKLWTAPHVRSLLAAMRRRASVVARLANHLPRGKYLWQLSYGLVMGKFAHAFAALARPRLANEDNASVFWSKIQVAFNNVARSITGVRRLDHVNISDLLDLAGITSANRMVVKAVAVEVWMYNHSDDGKEGSRNHIGSLLFEDNKTATDKKKTIRKDCQDHRPPQGGVTPSLYMRPQCGTSWSRCATRPPNRLVIFLQDLTSRLRLVGCSLRVVGRLLRDVGHLPGSVGRALQEVGRFFVGSSPLLFSGSSRALSLSFSSGRKIVSL
jgi:hypothetical protein